MTTIITKAVDLRKARGYWSKHQIAIELGVKIPFIYDLAKAGSIPEPTERYNGSNQRYYSEETALKIIEELKGR